jgi:D-arabinan exo alpha-(1,3)/(1,5)-arabinofuranosidase (non-reducing end)
MCCFGFFYFGLLADLLRPRAAIAVFIVLGLHGCGNGDTVHVNQTGDAPYLLGTGLSSHAISAENFKGKKGQGGRAASPLGVGRKGSPWVEIAAGETFELADINGSGTIRHIWMTTKGAPAVWRSVVIRAFWEGQAHPSIECPLGDFMGFAHGKIAAHQSAVHSLGERAGMNFWPPMPFNKRARLTLTNENEEKLRVYFQIDYTLGDKHPIDVGRLHSSFNRENPTETAVDFTILPRRRGKGRYLGALIGVRPMQRKWWGEGEVKIYLDGDEKFPTICGTGAEDYVGLSWQIQQTPYLYHGASLDQNGFVTMYRWHLPDPIYWEEDCRVTIQQIGWSHGLVEREDDWSAAAFWYEPIPSEPLPKMPALEQRTADLWSSDSR